MKIKFLTIAMSSAMLFAGSALAQPALIYDLAGKFDKSFNESAYNGAKRFADEFSENYSEFELQSDAQRVQALRRFAERGANPIVVAGFSYASALKSVAPNYPNSNFVIIDTIVDEPNVRSVVFKEEEGSYLVGILAAMASKTNTLGFVGGMDIPFIRRFSCGYVLGARSVKPKIKVLQNMTGTTGAAWNDPVRGGELTKAQIADGADVVYHAAGATGRGVLQAAADAKVLGIGVDSNQNYMHPGSILTSMVKLVDVAVYQAFKDAKSEKAFTTGVVSLGVGNGGVTYALDKHNASLITDEMKSAVEAAQKSIASGDLKVHDFMSTNSCPEN